jgi:hypothetical protein
MERKVLKQTGELAPMDQPWTLIRDAIRDLSLQEKMKSVKVDMATWHTFSKSDNVCYQCLAGSTMSRRLSVPMNTYELPGSFDRSINARLHALNYFRAGHHASALVQLNLHVTEGMRNILSDMAIIRYNVSPKQFKRDMLALADFLETNLKQNLIINA